MELSPTKERHVHARVHTDEHSRRQRQSAVPAADAHPQRHRGGRGRHGRHGSGGVPRPSRGRGFGGFDIDVLVLVFDGNDDVPERHEFWLVRFRRDGNDRRYGHGVLDDHHHDDDHCPHRELFVGHRDIGSDVVTGCLDTLRPALTARSFRAIGTTAIVVVQDPADAEVAVRALASELDAVDGACSRFRHDSELQGLHAEAGRTVAVSELLFEALSVAYRSAERTGGAVDPTIGNAIAALGYDADLDEVRARPPAPPNALGRVAGFQHVQLDPRRRTVRIPRGVRLDLGSSAKAWAADRAAVRVARRIGAGALVSLGGDVAVAGPPPPGGWAIGIARSSSTPPERADQVVAIHRGGLASSGTSTRTWKTGRRDVHHIIDPRTGDCVEPYWDVVSATGRSCVEANLVTTAAIVWGARALDELPRFGQAVRLVRADGKVYSVNGWPQDAAA
jgi:FAD:protein FMN transferase